MYSALRRVWSRVAGRDLFGQLGAGAKKNRRRDDFPQVSAGVCGKCWEAEAIAQCNQGGECVAEVEVS